MKLNVRHLGRGALAASVAAVCVLGVDAATSPAEARPPFACPDVWAPVKCPNGLIYSNSCYAKLAGQTGCVQVDPYNPL